VIRASGRGASGRYLVIYEIQPATDVVPSDWRDGQWAAFLVTDGRGDVRFSGGYVSDRSGDSHTPLQLQRRGHLKLK
jgi:hypothetical protein